MARTRHATDITDAGLSDDANNVLVIVPSHGGHERDVCTGLVAEERLSHTHVLAITYSWGSRAYQEALCDGEHRPAELVVVDTRGQFRGADEQTAVTVRSESPDDLTGLGIQTTEFLTRWYDIEDPVTVCFESLTALLQHVSLERAYRFLHIFTRRVQQADATAHYHMAAGAHDEQTVETLKQLFDAVVTPADEPGEFDVRTR